MIPIDHAKRLLEIRGFKIEDKEPVLASLLQLLALHPRIFGGENVDLKTMQSVLREHGFRLDDTDPVLLMLALNDIVLKDLKKRTKPERVDYVLPAGKLAAICIPLFVAGLLLGARDGIGWGFLAALTLGLGVGLVGGLLLYQGLISGGQVLPFSLGKGKEIQIKRVNDDAWTPTTFFRAAESMKPPLEARVAIACKHVLLDNMSVSNAAKLEKVFPQFVERALRQFRELEGKC